MLVRLVDLLQNKQKSIRIDQEDPKKLYEAEWLKSGNYSAWNLEISLKHHEGAEQVAGVAALVRVADELGVELLVALQGDAAGLLVVILQCIIGQFRFQALILDMVA